MIGLTIINLTIILIIDKIIGRITIDCITMGLATIDHIIINLTIGRAIIDLTITGTGLTATN